jgi:branched-chain amino acid transport system substrate-binding protein
LPLSALLLAAGIVAAAPPPQGDSPVRLGLLVPSDGDSARGQDARRGVELAVSQWNARGGIAGHPVSLVVRGVAGPWGLGSKAVVDLLFGERVQAFLESLDGRGAHVAEQVAVKSRTVMLSTWASDPTLAQAFIPWYFRVVPDDRRQATALVREIYQARRYRKVAVVAAEAYDARVAAGAFTHLADSLGHTVTLDLTYRDVTAEVQTLAERLAAGAVEALVLFGPPDSSVMLIRGLTTRGVKLPTFGSLRLAEALRCDSCRKDLENVVFVAPGHWYAPSGRAFVSAFQAAYGTPPGAAAAYAYDAAQVLLGAMEKSGVSRTQIQDALRRAGPWRGATGVIRFDARGNGAGPVDLVVVRGGKPRRLEAGGPRGGEP